MEKVFVPDLGGFENVEIIEVFIQEGDVVKKETPLFSLESDKAVMDIPSPVGGRVVSLHLKKGDKVSSGDLIGEIDTGEDVKDTAPSPETPEKVEKKVKEEKSVQSVASHLPESQDNNQASGIQYHASPSVRQYARELDIDLGVVTGTGPKNRIRREDLVHYIKNKLSSGGGTFPPPVPQDDYAVYGPVHEVPLTRIKRISGERLTGSWLNIPHVTQFDEADISSLEKFRKESDLRILPFIIKITAKALKNHPLFNASLSPSGKSLVLKDYYNIGIAVDTEDGLVVPVIKGVDTKSVVDIAEELKEKSELARNGKLNGEAYKGGSFTISSLGGIGGTGFTPIVNAPQSAILGISRAVMKPLWNESEFKPALMLPFSVSYDHRIIDGAEGARFARELRSLLEDIRRSLL